MGRAREGAEHIFCESKPIKTNLLATINKEHSKSWVPVVACCLPFCSVAVSLFLLSDHLISEVDFLSERMELIALQQQHHSLLSSMYEEGLLDMQFDQLQSLQDANNPGFVAEVINLFCDDSARILTELTKYLEMPVVDYQKVDAYVHQLKGSSSSIGAQRVKLSCVNFRQACEDNDKDGCMRALNMIKHEFYRVTNKFDTMLQLEQNILSYSATQQ